MLGLALQVSTFLRRGYGLRKEIDEKQKIELGGHPVSTVISPKFITQSLIHPPKNGRAQNFPDIKNKQA